jgi:DNA-binding Xre family transcriptional regulator
MRRMIRLGVRTTSEARGIMTAYQLQRAARLQPSVAARTWKGTLMRVTFCVLDRLCMALNCQPGRL